MEYIKKEDLKDGDIFVSQMSHHHFLNKYGTGYSLHLNLDNTIKYQVLYRNGGFAYNNMRLATPEEKHWLNEAIKLDKFITFEEAMKTFIPEYVECIKLYGKFIIGKIYQLNKDLWSTGYYIGNVYNTYFKPSTKEAYDVQFKTKEVVKVKPFEILSFKYGNGCPYYHTLRYNSFYVQSDQTIKSSTNYTLKEQLDDVNSRNCIIESVINEEGNIFMIDDIITPTIADSINKGKGFKITGFRLNNDKSMICAITNIHTPYGIGIDKIEHFIEKDEFVLPYKWKIKITVENLDILSKYFHSISENYLGYVKSWKTEINCFMTCPQIERNCWAYQIPTINSEFNNNYTEITFKQFKKYVLKEEHKPKVGDRFQINDKWNNSFYIITKIIDSENSYCEFKNEDGYNCSTVLLKNIKIIK